MLALAFGHFDTWQLEHKVSFDPDNRLIIVATPLARHSALAIYTS
jgi:hypothetical protein